MSFELLENANPTITLYAYMFNDCKCAQWALKGALDCAPWLQDKTCIKLDQKDHTFTIRPATACDYESLWVSKFEGQEGTEWHRMTFTPIAGPDSKYPDEWLQGNDWLFKWHDVKRMVKSVRGDIAPLNCIKAKGTLDLEAPSLTFYLKDFTDSDWPPTGAFLSGHYGRMFISSCFATAINTTKDKELKEQLLELAYQELKSTKSESGTDLDYELFTKIG